MNDEDIAKWLWLRCIDSIADYYESLSLEAQDLLLNPRQSPAQLDGIVVN